MRLALPSQVGSVRLKEPLGEGGMALVFRGEDPVQPGLGLAVKLLRPEVHGDTDLVRRFLREGEVLTRLRHPHIVEVTAFGMARSWPYLVMELLPGGSVKGCLGEPPARAVARFAAVASALGAAHAAGVIHRDLKPSNLLFAADGRLKVTDFGVCLWEANGETRVTRSQMVVGTLGYMAPEQHGDPRRVDGRCDVYALGAVLYEFTTGLPWSMSQLAPSAARTGYPPRLAGLVMAALAADPGRRTRDMATLEAGLRDWLESAEAAGWGAEPLTGPGTGDLEQPTLARSEPATPGDRLRPYLEALRTGAVGSRRAAADGLLRQSRSGDEAFLLEALPGLPDGSRFAVVQALGVVGGEPALEPVLALLDDAYARGEAAEAAARIALRLDRGAGALARIREPGLGQPWRWPARALLADPLWAAALAPAWPDLAAPLRLRALEAAAALPDDLRAKVRDALRPWIDAAGPTVRAAWGKL